MKLVKLSKRSVIYLWTHLNCQLQEVFNISNVMNLCRLTSFIKFNIERMKLIPKPQGMNLANIFQLSTFTRLMVLVTHAFQNKELTREKLNWVRMFSIFEQTSDWIYHLLQLQHREVLSVDKRWMPCLATFLH